MSATTKGVPISHTPDPSAPNRTRQRRGPITLHVYYREDIEMAFTCGIQIRALCGRWSGQLSRKLHFRDDDARPSYTRTCGRCASTRVYRGLD